MTITALAPSAAPGSAAAPGARSRAVAVLSRARGRLSVRCEFCRDRRAAALGIEQVLAAMHGVRSASVNQRTARVLVFFDPARTDEHDLLRVIATAPPLSATDLAARPPTSLPEEYRGHVARLVVGGAALALVVLKRVLTRLLLTRIPTIFLAGRLLAGALTLSANPVVIGVGFAVTLISGYPFLRGAMRTIGSREALNTDVLITTATLASLVLKESITALVVLWLLNLGELLQAITLHRTRRAIEDLLSIGDEDVWLLADGVEVRVPLERVRPGDVVAVYTGDKIPVDGDVVAGSATVNEAPITGESLPSYKNAGDAVFAGTVVELGSIRIRATRIGADTAVGRLIARVEQARDLQAPIETVGEGFSRRFVPFSFALSLLVLALTRDVRRAMTMLVIACPCAVGLSTPTAVSAAIGNAARRGVLIKGGIHLEAAEQLDTVVFDKTGTLTTGQARVARVLSLTPEYPPAEVLRIAASGELHSKHPLALAVLRYTRDLEVEIPEHEECEVIVGRGMRADMGGNRILVGSERLLAEFDVPAPDDLPALVVRFRHEGETVLIVAVNEVVIGLIGVRDLIRPEAMEALALLQHAGVRRVMLLTGDSEETAAIVAGELGLAEFRGDLLPEDKFRLVQRLKDEGHAVAMVGDGINDAPALALADLGIAMGAAGSDIAIEAADVALAGNDVRDVATTLELSRRTLAVVRQNYVMAVGVNSAGIFVGALGALNPALAALLHNLSTIAVVINSSRLIGWQPARLGRAPAASERRTRV